ncbi:MAG: hypothetical protein HKP61_22720 [Dactylosporangium sp.]|nr:hypothetical protein [Dactylosporangium sp.]NNJ63692.1 hypothetical protein [Dactylosporangium sp.]
MSAAAQRFCGQVSTWTAARWAGPAATGLPRADTAHHLVQQIADLTAAAEGTVRRTVPRLPHDGALSDQLKVVVADLLAAAPPAPVIARAVALVTQTAAALVPSTLPADRGKTGGPAD